jgi:hypothetical protein
MLDDIADDWDLDTPYKITGIYKQDQYYRYRIDAKFYYLCIESYKGYGIFNIKPRDNKIKVRPFLEIVK